MLPWMFTGLLDMKVYLMDKTELTTTHTLGFTAKIFVSRKVSGVSSTASASC